MRRLRRLSELHLPVIVTVLVAAVSEAVTTNIWLRAAAAAAAGITVRQVGESRASSKRVDCEMLVARGARAVLDSRLSMTRIDQMVLGRWLTPRRLAELSADGRLRRLVVFGGPASDLAREFRKLDAWFETTVSRCHVRMDARGQEGIEMFVGAMNAVVGAADRMINVAPFGEVGYEPLYAQLAASLIRTQVRGDELDRYLDERGARTASDQRESAERAAHDREQAAVAILVTNARSTVRDVQQAQRDGLNPATMAALVVTAAKTAHEVGADPFFNATDEARLAHRAITSTLVEAEAASGTLAASAALSGPGDPAVVASLEACIARLPMQLAALEALAR